MPTIDFSRLEAALSTPRGQLELAALVGCIVLAWLVDRRYSRAHANVDSPHADRVSLGLFPIVLLLLVMVARAAFAQSGPLFFLDLAIPLAIALALIRILVYTVRRLFPRAAWLKGSERLIAFVIWVIVALHFLGITTAVNGMLDEVVVPLGKGSASLFTIGQGFVVVLVTIAATLWLSGFLERRLMATSIDINTRVVLSRFLRAFLVVLGVLISLPAIGVDLTLLSVFGGALGVGIGLGLQKLAANYIAGFAILLDRSIKVGDMVTVDNRFGTVTRVTSRYAVVRGLDGVEAIVPNETLVTTTVLNHSPLRRQIRIPVALQVAYGTDIDRALALLLEASEAEPRVLRDGERKSEALVTGFGDSGIGLELGVWIADPENGQTNVRSTVSRRILQLFAKDGIQITYPQREIRVVGPPGGPSVGPTPSPSKQ